MQWQDMPCNEWQGSRNEKGYGYRRYTDSQGRRRTGKAHRIEWELHNGPIPDGMMVLHRCDNPPCREIAHLRLGTAADNAKDRDTKGRSGYTKLTDLDVQEIKRLHASGVSIMRIKGEFGVGRRAVERALGRGR